MAYWCTNILKISGEEKDIVAFIEKVKDYHFTIFNNIFNLLDEYRDEDPKFTDGVLICRFATPWSPPIEWVKEIAKIFPELTFDFRYSTYKIGLYGHIALEGNKIAILDYCDGCDCEEECKKKIWNAIFTLMKTHPDKWPKVPSCEPCLWQSLCALLGLFCIDMGCESQKIKPFQEFLETKGANLESIQTAKKDFKRYRKIEVKI